jgi:hypothetical protein
MDTRSCSRCGCADRIVTVLDDDGNPVDEHYVKPDIAFINRKEITQRESKQGWRYLFFQGKDAMVRYSCESCINQQEDADDVWSILRSAAKAAEDKQKAPTFYNILCGD